MGQSTAPHPRWCHTSHSPAGTWLSSLPTGPRRNLGKQNGRLTNRSP